MNDYLNWIDSKIDFHQREIVKLVMAREVLADAGKEIKPAKPAKVKTVRTRSPKQERLVASRVRALILEACSNMRRKPKHIVNIVQETLPEVTDKQVWNHIWHLKNNMAITRDEEGTYTTTKAIQAA